MAEEVSQGPDIRELTPPSPEQFIPLNSMTRLVQATLAPRFNTSGELLPLQERRTLSSAEYLRKPLPPVERSDMVIPPKERVILQQGSDQIRLGYRFDVRDSLGRALRQYEPISLTAKDIENLLAERAAILHDFDGSDQYIATENLTQDDFMGTGNASIRINRVPTTQDEGTDFAGNMRVYFHGGIDGLRVARRMIEEGAIFDNAKVWIPDYYEGQQRFRSDTPIFEATTAAQLQSLIQTLRKLNYRGELPQHARQQPLVGIPVDGLHGVYLGQKTPMTSFNGQMQELFGEPIQDAVLQTTSQIPIHAGDKPPDGWFETVATGARSRALGRASSLGINPHNHALLVGQDPQQILPILHKAA